MPNRLDQRKENDVTAADIVSGQLVIKRYDGSTLKIGTYIPVQPVLTSMTPDTAVAGTNPLVLVFIGSEFTSECQIVVDHSTGWPAIYVSPTELHMDWAALGAPAGVYDMKVSGDDGSNVYSDSLTLTIT